MAAQPERAAATEVLSFERGLDRDSARTKVKPGGYDDAQNIILLGANSSKHPTTVGIDSVLDPLVSWPTGNPQWCAPFSYSSYVAATQVLSFNTHLLIARAGGQYHRYDAGSPGTVTNVRRLVNVAGTADRVWQINDFVYDRWLCTVDGRNAPMKYGQHFFGPTGETTPYMFPIGSRPISSMGPQLTGETYGFTAGGSVVADVSVPGGGSRVGSQSVSLPATAQFNVLWATAQDFTVGPTPYGGRTFANTDSFVFSYFKTATGATPTLSITFYAPDLANHYTVTTGSLATASSWFNNTAFLRSAFVATGAPNWNNVTQMFITNNDATQALYIDDVYWLYSDAPPSAQVGVSHKDRIVLGGSPLIGAVPSLGTIIYSNAQQPDNFANAGTNNTQNISGGFESLAKTNQITALREYQDSVIVGTPSAIFAWTVGTSGTPAKSTISTEHGIDAQRGVIETPNGSLIFPWQHGYYILRATGRQFIGSKIQPFIANMATDDPSWTIAVLDEATKSIRFWFREGLNATSVTNGLIFDYVQAQETAEAVWTSKMTQMADWAVPVYINGARHILYTQAGSAQIFVLGGSTTGNLTSYITLPWMGTADDVNATKWMGADLAYLSPVPVDVQVRYATNPQEFDTSTFVSRRILPASPGVTEQARILFGGTTRWAQIKVQATTLAGGGFELFPPVKLVPVPTDRPGG
jgi:hypothetical protein